MGSAGGLAGKGEGEKGGRGEQVNREIFALSPLTLFPFLLPLLPQFESSQVTKQVLQQRGHSNSCSFGSKSAPA